MHEHGLVRLLLDQVEAELKSRQLYRLQSVRVAIGEFSGVEPRLFALAFDEATPHRWSAPVTLQWDVVPLQARCAACQCCFEVKQFRFVCPTCECRQVEVIAGEEIRLISVTASSVQCGSDISPAQQGTS